MDYLFDYDDSDDSFDDIVTTFTRRANDVASEESISCGPCPFAYRFIHALENGPF